jgi:predicted kinase
VLLSGPPASGKSTLAGHLARACSLPVVSRDALKEQLADVLGAPTYAEGERVGREADALTHQLTLALGRTGAGVVTEGWLQRGASEPIVRPLLDTSRVVQVHCAVPPDAVIERYAARFARGERHPCHYDGEKIARVRSGAVQVDWTRFAPLDLAVPTRSVGTAAGYTPALDEILSFVRAAAAE